MDFPLTLVRVELTLVLGQYNNIVTMPVDGMGDYNIIVKSAIVS